MNSKHTNSLIPLLCAAIFAITTTVAQAQVVVDFNGNADGLLVGQNTNTSVGLTGNWGGGGNVNGSNVISTDGNLTSTYAIAQSGTAKQLVSGTPSNVNSVRRATLSGALTGTVYFSYLAQLTGNVDRLGITLNSASDTFGTSGIDLISVATAGTANSVTAADVRLRNGGTNLTGTGTNPFTLTTPGAVNFYVGRITFNVSGSNDQIEYWVNPDLSGGTLGTANFNTGTAAGDLLGSSLTVFGVGFYGASGALGTDGISGRMDNIRFGNNLSDVAVVPEPSTWLGAGLVSGLAAWSLRKRLAATFQRAA